MRRWSRWSLLGLPVKDWQGEEVGRVIDTWPLDGGGEPELVVVRLRKFGQRLMVPTESLLDLGGALLAPYTRTQLEDAPALGDGTVGADDPYRARAYWLFEERAGAFTRIKRSTLPPRWRASSGFSGTGKRFPTTPRPTTIAS
jgi:hypothetical protein